MKTAYDANSLSANIPYFSGMFEKIKHAVDSKVYLYANQNVNIWQEDSDFFQSVGSKGLPSIFCFFPNTHHHTHAKHIPK